MSVTIGVSSSVTLRPGQPQTTSVALIMEDQPQSPTTPTKRDRDQDQSSILEEDSPKQTCLSRRSALRSATPLLNFSTIQPA